MIDVIMKYGIQWKFSGDLASKWCKVDIDFSCNI
jgi:hypothetical protein